LFWEFIPNSLSDGSIIKKYCQPELVEGDLLYIFCTGFDKLSLTTIAACKTFSSNGVYLIYL